VLEYVARFHLQGTLSTSAFAAWFIGLSWYLVSIVFGRLYTGMHSITDCVMGVLLGTGVWAIHYFAQDAIRHLVTTGDWTVPAVTVLVGMILVHKHPQPVDDCPCFEDAIAFVSVVIGIVLGWWHGARVGWLAGAPAVLAAPPWLPWWAVGTLKLVGGVLAIFGWRLVAKATLHTALPPIFRLLARAVALPNRRFYTPATDYAHVPADGLHPIPSMIDLTSLGVEEEQDAHVTSASGIREGVVRRSNGKSARVASESGRLPEKQSLRISGVDVKGEDVKHYDADGQSTRILLLKHLLTIFYSLDQGRGILRYWPSRVVWSPTGVRLPGMEFNVHFVVSFGWLSFAIFVYLRRYLSYHSSFLLYSRVAVLSCSQPCLFPNIRFLLA
jgi:hypothetical protein